MIKRFGDYDQTKSYGSFEQLPKGGYVLQIKGVEILTNRIGEYLEISADIFEGEYKDFFAKEYKAQQSEDKKWHCKFFLNIPKDDGSERDGWTKRSFKTFTETLEESNEGYHFDWDELKFKGKLIGGIFNKREYKTDRMVTNWKRVTTVQRIRDGAFTIPDDDLLQPSSQPRPVETSDDGFLNLPEDMEDDLPFA